MLSLRLIRRRKTTQKHKPSTSQSRWNETSTGNMHIDWVYSRKTLEYITSFVTCMITDVWPLLSHSSLQVEEGNHPGMEYGQRKTRCIASSLSAGEDEVGLESEGNRPRRSLYVAGRLLSESTPGADKDFKFFNSRSRSSRRKSRRWAPVLRSMCMHAAKYGWLWKQKPVEALSPRRKWNIMNTIDTFGFT